MNLSAAYTAGCEVLGDDMTSFVPWLSALSSATGSKSAPDAAKQKEALARAIAEQKSKDRQAAILVGIIGTAALVVGVAIFTLLRRK